MSVWSRRRKLSITLIVAIALIVLFAIPIFLIFYKPPTCFDGMKNGDEIGVDCGGSCQRLCPSAFITPVIAWTRFEQVSNNLYNVAAYIINPNIDGEAYRVPYHLSLYDDHGILIVEQNGTVTLAPHRNSLAFAGAVSVGKRVPAKALFEFTSIPNWHKRSDPLASLVIGNKNYTEDASGSSLLVSLKNVSAHNLGRMTVYAILYDVNSNAIGFSKTVIDAISGYATAQAPFTWPDNRKGKVISIEVLPVAE